MKTFFQLKCYLLILIVSLNALTDLIECNDIIDAIKESATEEGVDFWNWVFADEVNTTDEHKPSSHLKDELEYHYGIKMDDKSSHLAEEMDFHMFNLHDFDKNKFLDGLELLSMLDNHGSGHHSPQHVYSKEQNIAMVDKLLRTDDINDDGFLDYNEFKSAKTKHNINNIRV